MVEWWKQVSQHNCYDLGHLTSYIVHGTWPVTFNPTPVSVMHVDEVLTQVLSLMAALFGQHHVKWFMGVIGGWHWINPDCSTVWGATRACHLHLAGWALSVCHQEQWVVWDTDPEHGGTQWGELPGNMLCDLQCSTQPHSHAGSSTTWEWSRLVKCYPLTPCRTTASLSRTWWSSCPTCLCFCTPTGGTAGSEG